MERGICALSSTSDSQLSFVFLFFFCLVLFSDEIYFLWSIVVNSTASCVWMNYFCFMVSCTVCFFRINKPFLLYTFGFSNKVFFLVVYSCTYLSSFFWQILLHLFRDDAASSRSVDYSGFSYRWSVNFHVFKSAKVHVYIFSRC